MTLKVNGLVGISGDPPIEESKTNKGSFFNFYVGSPSPDNIKKTTRYNTSIFIPTEERQEWKEKIRPGNIFLIENGTWEMHEVEDYKHPIPKLKVTRFGFHHLVTPYWLEEKK